MAWLCPATLHTIVTSCSKQAGRQQGCRVDPGAAIPDMAEARQGDGLVRAGGATWMRTVRRAAVKVGLFSTGGYDAKSVDPILF